MRDFLFEPLQLAGFLFTDPDAHMHLSLPVARARGRVASSWEQLVGSNFFSQHSSCWKKKSAHSQGILFTKCASLRLLSSLSEKRSFRGIRGSMDISTLIIFVNQPTFHSVLRQTEEGCSICNNM